MYVLGIETSCDETAAAVVRRGRILSNIVATQTVHQKYGGVVPEFASRAHMRQLIPIIRSALDQARISLDKIDAYAATYGPGLAGSLLVGLCVCKGLALSRKKPWIGINHIEGHILAAADENMALDYPHVSLVASGGHTLLVLVKEPLQYRLIGKTIDDAAGEAFDKVSKVLGLGYPGGPLIEKYARTGNDKAIAFPRALMEGKNLDFSFSGLKTAVLYYILKEEVEKNIADITASFQKAVIDVLIAKSMRALQLHRCKTLILAGGVIRNNALRKAFELMCSEQGYRLVIPAPELCTDNAAMIARAGYLHLKNGKSSVLTLEVQPNLSL